jgi:hypothetical protein
VSARELNETLARILAGIWCEVEPERERLLVQFALREQRTVKLAEGEPAPLGGDREWLSPARFGYQPLESPKLTTQPPFVARRTP